MMGNLIFDLLYVAVFVGGFCLLLAFGEVLFDFAYKHIPWVRHKWDAFCETLPDWDDEEEVV